MLREAFDWATTPTDRLTRWSGQLSEFVAIAARRRRHRAAWAGHEARSQAALLRAGHRADPDGTALILGAGHLNDVPLEELALHFAQVALVDLAFAAGTRRRAKALRNVSCVRHDVTECREDLAAGKTGVPRPKTMIHDDRITFVASANLLSQLPIGAGRLLAARAKPEATVERVQKEIVLAHLDWLNRFRCPVQLITDVAYEIRTPRGALAATIDPLYGVPLPEPTEGWIWHLAPVGEIDPAHAVDHRVVAIDGLTRVECS